MPMWARHRASKLPHFTVPRLAHYHSLREEDVTGRGSHQLAS